MSNKKILVVCHGNINRSPLAAEVLRTERPELLIEEAALKPNGGGYRAAAKMRKAAQSRGYDLEHNRSQEITPTLASWADEIIYMDGGNLKRLLNMFPEHQSKFVCLAVFVGKKRIPDPNFMKGDSPEFYEIVDLIIQSTKVYAATI